MQQERYEKAEMEIIEFDVVDGMEGIDIMLTSAGFEQEEEGY